MLVALVDGVAIQQDRLFVDELKITQTISEKGRLWFRCFLNKYILHTILYGW